MGTDGTKRLVKLPRLNLNVQTILMRVDETKECLTYDSDICGMAYAAETDRLLIVTGSKGYLLMKREDILIMIEELKHIYEEMELWKRRK